MLISLLAPEALLYFALSERADAVFLLKKVRVYHPELVKPGMIGRIRNYISGLVNSSEVRECRIPNHNGPVLIHWTEQKHYKPGQPCFSSVHAFYATMEGFVFEESDDGNILTVEESHERSTNPHSTVISLRIKTLAYILKYFPHILTDISEDSILDHAQSSALSKVVLIAQVISFCVNCASRILLGLPLSLLEISTVAHAFCTLLTYFVWWSKPLNIAAPTVLRGKEAREVYALFACENEEYYEALAMARTMAVGNSSTRPAGKRQKIIMAANALQHLLPNPEKPPGRGFYSAHVVLPGSWGVHSHNDGTYENISMAISCLVYGLIHLLALNVHFPTPLERLLWLVSLVVVACSGLVVVLLEWFGRMYIPILGITSYIAKLLVPLAYICTSGFLLGESFRQLFFLGPAVYQLPSWPNYWPHFACA